LKIKQSNRAFDLLHDTTCTGTAGAFSDRSGGHFRITNDNRIVCDDCVDPLVGAITGDQLEMSYRSRDIKTADLRLSYSLSLSDNQLSFSVGWFGVKGGWTGFIEKATGSLQRQSE
jgi:hypothetical protein